MHFSRLALGLAIIGVTTATPIENTVTKGLHKRKTAVDKAIACVEDAI